MRRIAVFTGTRADYGLLYWLMTEIHQSEQLELGVIVAAAHLSPEFGNTQSIIEQDGFPIVARVEMLLSSDSPVGIAKSMGLGTIGFADALNQYKPDILVVLGDRFEALAIAQVAMVLQIPIAHIHGGELTQGMVDEAVRHSITKMSHLHFTSTEAYRQRVIQLGEHPNTVFNVGAPGLESFRRMDLMSRAELESDLEFKLGTRCLLVTFHPVTLSRDGAKASLGNLLEVLETQFDTQIVITYPNADTFGRDLITMIQAFAARHSAAVKLVTSLGQKRYLSLMKHCTAVVGNSSSGIIEAPTAGVPTLDIGDRQLGRIRAESVIHCDESIEGIRAGLETVMSDAFGARCRGIPNPYGDGLTASRITEVLAGAELDSIIQKRFYDLADHDK